MGGSALIQSTSAEEVQKEALGPFITKFQAAYPTFDGNALTPEQSVTAQLDVISKLTAKDSGAFLTHHGDTTSWF